MGLSHYVFNGATHHRFAHALGAMHLMRKTLDILITKGTPISDSEREAAMIAILLHDLGHGPFSHALEGILTDNVSHGVLVTLFDENAQRKTQRKTQSSDPNV